MSRLRRWWPAGKGDQLALAALGVLVLAGLVLRVLISVQIRSAFIGIRDTFSYTWTAQDALFTDPTHPVGYAILLRALHLLDGSLWTIAIAQHILGVATALLLFATVRRVAPAGWALVPAAVVVLAGPQLFIEHAVLSESLFSFLMAAAIYCAVRALGGQPAWAYLAGLLGGAAGCVRAVALVMPILVAVLLVVGGSPRWTRRVILACMTLLAGALPVAAYAISEQRQAGYVGPDLTRGGGFSLYIGVASFADCDRFTPPRGTERLCQDIPPSDRPGPLFYNNPAGSPGFQEFGRLRPADNAALAAWARAAILHQPFDWLREGGTDLTRYWSSDHHWSPTAGESYDAFMNTLTGPVHPATLYVVHPWYQTVRVAGPGDLALLRDYERHTRLEGLPFVALTLLALAGIPLARGRRLMVGLFILGVSIVLLVAPVMGSFFDARFAIPGYGPLAAAGAVGAATLWERVAAWQLSRSGSPARAPPRADPETSA